MHARECVCVCTCKFKVALRLVICVRRFVLFTCTRAYVCKMSASGGCVCVVCVCVCVVCVCVCVQAVCSRLPRTPYGVRGDKCALGAALSSCLWTLSSAH